MKKAYTLIELIFVIVIIGVLAGVASSSYRPNYLKSDIEFISMQIKQAQYKGIGYEHLGMNLAIADYINGCINIEKNAFEERATDGNLAYKLHLDAFDEGTVCFDSKGRPYSGNFLPANLMTVDRVIDLTFDGVTQSITIYAMSGYVGLPCE